ncbi:MAG: hypothetical protein Tsb002_16950 [Wenzhouxiangellaceae bacterium]
MKMNKMRLPGSLIIGASLLAACAGTPTEDPRIAPLRAEYEQLASDPQLAPYGGDELKRAENAVRRLSDSRRDYSKSELELAIFTTDRIIDIARLEAQARYDDDQREQLVQERERLVLESRTREAERAQRMALQARQEAAEALAIKEQALREAEEAQAARAAALEASRLADQARAEAAEKQQMAEEAARMALSDAEQARLVAEAEAARAAEARLEAEEARAAAAAAQADRDALRSRLSELEAKQTERGLLLTLGDVLFEFGKADLKSGAARNLQPLIDALNERPQQTVVVEGHTDSVGSREFNLRLSQQRAEAVRDYLVENGIASGRISTEGLGPDYPVAGNDSAEGRQRNRRVEVILPNMEDEPADA